MLATNCSDTYWFLSHLAFPNQVGRKRYWKIWSSSTARLWDGWYLYVRCRLNSSPFHVRVGRTKHDFKLQGERFRLGILGTFMTVKERRNEVDFGKVVDPPSRWPLKWDNGASAIDVNRCIDTGIFWARNWANIQINIRDPIWQKPVSCLNFSGSFRLALVQPWNYYWLLRACGLGVSSQYVHHIYQLM